MINKDECKSCLYKSLKFYCNKSQYCCADKCCEDIEDLDEQWFFWPIIVLILALALAAIIWWSRRYYRSAQTKRYRQLTEESVKSPPSVIVNEIVVTAKPYYMGETTGYFWEHQQKETYSCIDNKT